MTTLRPASFALLLLILPLLAVVACNDITGAEDEDITGTWTSTQPGDKEYVVITRTELTAFVRESGDSCFQRFTFDIVSSIGYVYTLAAQPGGDTRQLTIRRDGDDLEIGYPGASGGATYASTSENVADLDVCVGGGVGDTSVACTQLEQIEVGGTVTGALSTSDDMAPSGAYYDMYGLQLSAQQGVRIDLSSSEIDSYLYLYDSDGTLVASNDDFGDGADSSLIVNLVSGCYRIEASSLDAGETGSYTLSVN